MKKSIISIIVAVCIMSLVGCGELSKVNKAIENNDLATVANYYGQLKEDDKAEVSEKMRLYCQDLSVGYTDESIDYESVKAAFDILGQEVLKEDENFDGMLQSVELLHTSREAYKLGNELFLSGDYEKALEEYAKVLPSDSHIEEVKKNIEECKVKLLPDVVGTWENRTNIGKTMSYMLGLGGDDKFQFDMINYYEFREDGSGVKYADEEAIKEGFEGFIEAIIDMMVNQYRTQYGISKEQLNKEFRAQYGMDMDKYIKKQSNLDATLKQMEMADKEFEYTVEDTTVNVTFEDGNFVTLTREGDELLLEVADVPELTKVLEQYGVEFPMRFTKK